MDLSILPNQTVPLTEAGINALLEKMNREPALGVHVQDALRENPRRTLFRLFELTAVQRSIIRNMSDSDITRYASAALGVKFGTAAPPKAKFDADPVFSGDKPIKDNLDVAAISCHCHVDIS
jgi:hypothetical protein